MSQNVDLGPSYFFMLCKIFLKLFFCYFLCFTSKKTIQDLNKKIEIRFPRNECFEGIPKVSYEYYE